MGDGNLLKITTFPTYVGYDVSQTIIEKCREIFKEDDSKEFRFLADFEQEKFDLSLSLDVIYHLIEDHVFDDYMRKLFGCSDNLVVIYSSNKDQSTNSPHVRHRNFVSWVHQNFGEF